MSMIRSMIMNMNMFCLYCIFSKHQPTQLRETYSTHSRNGAKDLLAHFTLNPTRKQSKQKKWSSPINPKGLLKAWTEIYPLVRARHRSVHLACFVKVHAAAPSAPFVSPTASRSYLLECALWLQAQTYAEVCCAQWLHWEFVSASNELSLQQRRCPLQTESWWLCQRPWKAIRSPAKYAW